MSGTCSLLHVCGGSREYRLRPRLSTLSNEDQQSNTWKLFCSVVLTGVVDNFGLVHSVGVAGYTVRILVSNCAI